LLRTSFLSLTSCSLTQQVRPLVLTIVFWSRLLGTATANRRHKSPENMR
jgi:hypothetical protein